MREIKALAELITILFVYRSKIHVAPSFGNRFRHERIGVKSLAASKSYDPVLDWKAPSNKEIQEARQRILEPMKTLTSPVFFSTDATGRRHEGLSHIPKTQSPILFVSNHQLVGLDSFLVVNELMDQCDILVRSLTHPFLYPNDKPDGTSFLETFGCLPVTTRNYYRLLQTQQPILLFPGGARESFAQSQKEAYQMIAWTDDKGDFVRAAAKFGGTIVPFSSIGAAESAFFAGDFVEENSISLIQTLLQTAAGPRAPTNACYDSSARIKFPLVVPKPLPCRHYFLFHKPVDLAGINHKDREACERIYKNIKQTIQGGCRELLRAKEKDQFDDPLFRVPYEQFWRKQAPSFPVQVLNS
jgi:hypothetical protein